MNTSSATYDRTIRGEQPHFCTVDFSVVILETWVRPYAFQPFARSLWRGMRTAQIAHEVRSVGFSIPFQPSFQGYCLSWATAIGS